MTFSFVVTTWQWLDNDLTKRYKKTLSSLQTTHQRNWTIKKNPTKVFQHGQDLVNHQGMLWACSFGQTLSQRFLDAARGCLVAYGRSLETTAPGGDAKATRMEEPTDDQRLGWFGKWRIEWWWLDHVPPWNVERKWRMNEHWHSYFIGPQGKRSPNYKPNIFHDVTSGLESFYIPSVQDLTRLNACRAKFQ